ncbi:MAG: sce7726 family protein, partial [Roseibium sp.]
GLAHARSRIDVAVINGCIHGYEIKSAKDNLDRFATQIEIYRQTLQKLTLVAAPKHVLGIINQAPEWCGLIAAEQGPRGGINFQVLRNAVANPEIDPVMMAHLLWRDEVIELLEHAGYARKELRQPRKRLYVMLCEAMTLREITASIRGFMAQRRTWRDRPARASCDG